MPRISPPEIDRSLCAGSPPLSARLGPWMQEVVAGQMTLPPSGSPVHLHDVTAFGRNVGDLQHVADSHGLDFVVFFARKANKALAYVEEAGRLEIGVDTASEVELEQTLAAGLAPERVIITAAIKQRPLMERAARTGCVVAIDNPDELDLLAAVATKERPANAMLRISGFAFDGVKLPSRFGVDIDQAAAFVSQCWDDRVTLAGVHFHLDGYSRDQRAAAIPQALSLIDALREMGHPVRFLDIGGGFPMSYLDDAEQWTAFQQAVADRPAAITWDATPYRTPSGGWSTYPYYQQPTQGDWFDALLAEVAPAIRDRGIQLRCEPGRSILDGCGMTVADVVYRKRLADTSLPSGGAFTGDWAIGLAMNRTQCRTTSEDFLVDPLLIHADSREPRPPSMTGFLAGAYCMESEFLTKRRLHFPQGVAVGDRVAFPNTAGYLMHFLESRSHQFPLAENYVRENGAWRRDALEG